MLTAEMVRRVRVFTGHGLLAVKRALEACDGDELLACGYLRYEGSLINLKGGDMGAWLLDQARAYAEYLETGPNGEIRFRDADPPPQSWQLSGPE